MYVTCIELDYCRANVTYQGITKPVKAFVHPNSRIFSKAKGKADSLEAELKANNQGLHIVLKNGITGIRAINIIGMRTRSKKITRAA